MNLAGLFGATLAALGNNTRGIVLYGLSFFVLLKLILLPFQAWLLRILIQESGAASIVNFDMATFLISPIGLLWLVSLSVSTLTILTLQQSGSILQALATNAGLTITLSDKLSFTLRSAPRILSVSVAPTVLLLIIGAVLAGWLGFVSKWFLSNHDINFYLAERPAEFFWAIGLSTLGVLAVLPFVLTIVCAWSVSLPNIIAGDGWWFAPLREGWQLAKGNRFRALYPLTVWAAAVAVVIGLSSSLLFGIARFLVGLIDNNQTVLVIVTGILVVFVELCLGLIAVIAVSGYAFLSEKISATIIGQTPMPALSKTQNQLISLWPSNQWRPALVMTVLAALSVGSAYALVATAGPTVTPLVIAHRGSSIAAPENTIAAFQLAMKEGADVIELDVQQTKDGAIVVLHDKDVARSTGSSGNIWQLTAADVEALSVEKLSGPSFVMEGIPRLQDVLSRFGQSLELFIELKINGHNPTLAKDTIALLKAIQQPKRHSIISLDYATLQEVKRVDAAIRTGLLVSAKIGDITTLNVDFLAISHSLATEQFLADARLKQLPIYVWTVNDEDQMVSMIQRGVNGIITDNPALLRTVIKQQSAISDTERLLIAVAKRLGAK